MRPTWVSEAEALAYIAGAVGAPRRGWEEYLGAAQDGKFFARARKTFMAHVQEQVPRE
jgi:hypothetical protein